MNLELKVSKKFVIQKLLSLFFRIIIFSIIISFFLKTFWNWIFSEQLNIFLFGFRILTLKKAFLLILLINFLSSLIKKGALETLFKDLTAPVSNNKKKTKFDFTPKLEDRLFQFLYRLILKEEEEDFKTRKRREAEEEQKYN